MVGFAAETENLEANARAKLAAKGCDWVCANDVGGGTDTFGGANNRITLVTPDDTDAWPEMSKEEVATRLAERIAQHIGPAE